MTKFAQELTPRQKVQELYSMGILLSYQYGAFCSEWRDKWMDKHFRNFASIEEAYKFFKSGKHLEV